MANLTAGQEAMVGVFRSKMPTQDCRGNYQQTLVNNSTFAAATPVASKNFGNPTQITLILRATVAATYQVFHSIDGLTFFHDTSRDQTFAGPGDKVVTIPGANFIKIVTSVDQTAGAYVIATANF